MWQDAQTAGPRNSSFPRSAFPAVGPSLLTCTLRMYAITCQISSSVMPTPCCVAPFGGMAVPGTPSLMVRKRSVSELPCFFCARGRSGPRPPPRAPSPWQNAQLARNSNSPSFAALGSLARGFLSCARAGPAIPKNSVAWTAKVLINRRGLRERQTPIFLLQWSAPKISPHYTTGQREKTVDRHTVLTTCPHSVLPFCPSIQFPLSVHCL